MSISSAILCVMSSSTCSVAGCQVLAHARGWCAKHWHRWYRTGAPEGAPIRSLEERFWQRVDKDGRCWEWTGALGNGYGKFSVDGAAVYAHRFSYRLHHGPIPDGAVIRHLCNNKKCVNPDHLEAGTQLENLRDAVKAGAMGRKLQWWQANGIRYKYLRGEYTTQEIADMYSVSRQMVWRIAKGRSWSLKRRPPAPTTPVGS